LPSGDKANIWLEEVGRFDGDESVDIFKEWENRSPMAPSITKRMKFTRPRIVPAAML
jgi:hypothetical protein